MLGDHRICCVTHLWGICRAMTFPGMSGVCVCVCVHVQGRTNLILKKCYKVFSTIESCEEQTGSRCLRALPKIGYWLFYPPPTHPWINPGSTEVGALLEIEYHKLWCLLLHIFLQGCYIPRQMTPDRAIHNSKGSCQIYFRSFELQIKYKCQWALTLQREEETNSFLGRHEFEKQRCLINHQVPFPQDLWKVLLPRPSHYFPLPSTYQNIDLIKHFQTDSLNKHHGSLDTCGTHGHTVRNYLCSNTDLPTASAWADQELHFDPGWPPLIQVNSPSKTHWAKPVGITHFHLQCLLAG